MQQGNLSLINNSLDVEKAHNFLSRVEKQPLSPVLPTSIETLYDIFHAKNTLCKYELDLFLVILFNIKPCVMQAASRKQLQATGSSFFDFPALEKIQIIEMHQT